MSIAGILSSNLFSTGTGLNPLRTHGGNGNAPKFEEIKDQFQQLGQDLKSGNLKQAQADYATLSSIFPGANQAGATAAAATTAASAAASTSTTTGTTATTPASTATATGQSTAAQQFAQLGHDLQSGNLQAAQQDFTNLQQSAQQNGVSHVPGQHHRHGHHHHRGGTQSASSVSSSSQQSNPIAQAFSSLGQDLQAGNLSGAQSAFATLQNDLQQLGGFSSSGSNSSSATTTASSSTTGGSLNVTA